MSTDPQEFEKDLQLPKKWDYETFREYLLSQARGKDFLLPIDQFPREIEISESWHEVLNSIRTLTNRDEIERVALVGFNLNQRRIYLPIQEIAVIPWQWEKNTAVSGDAIKIQMGLAKTKDAEGFVGILHSHPNQDINILNFTLKSGRLSGGDLHIALTGFYGPLMGVAAGAINSFAFKTKESIVPRETMDKFYDLWEGEPQPKDVDLLIARKYNLALYKGGVNQPLKRVA